jgi:hypothetical protein
MHCKCFKTKNSRKYLDLIRERERENIYCQVTEIKETGLDMKLQMGIQELEIEFLRRNLQNSGSLEDKEGHGRINFYMILEKQLKKWVRCKH